MHTSSLNAEQNWGKPNENCYRRENIVANKTKILLRIAAFHSVAALTL